MVEAVYLSGFFVSRQPAIQSPQLPESYVNLLLETSMLEAAEFLTPPSLPAHIWLAHKELDDNQIVEIWLEAPVEAEIAEIKLHYPQQVEINQLEYGEAEAYLTKAVDFKDNLITLTAYFKTGFVGKLLLGKIYYQSMSDDLSDWNFEYLPNSKQGSYVLSLKDQIHLLNRPNHYEF